MTTADAIHVKQTVAFINEAPMDIIIHRRHKEEVPSGGFKWVNDPDLAPQTVRKLGRYVSSANVGGSGSRTTTDGQVVVPNAIIIGLPDFDVQIGDTFDIDGISHEVMWVSDLPPWRRAVEVYEHG